MRTEHCCHTLSAIIRTVVKSWIGGKIFSGSAEVGLIANSYAWH